MTVTRMAPPRHTKTTLTRIPTWTRTIPVNVHTFESPGLAVQGPYHGEGGPVNTGHDAILVCTVEVQVLRLSRQDLDLGSGLSLEGAAGS